MLLDCYLELTTQTTSGDQPSHYWLLYSVSGTGQMSTLSDCVVNAVQACALYNYRYLCPNFGKSLYGHTLLFSFKKQLEI